MKYLEQYPVFRLLFVIYLFDSVIGTDNIYERVSGYVQDSEYVDPQSLYYNRQSQTVKVPKNYELDESHSNQITVQRANVYGSCKDNSYEVFSRRLVNMIISKSNIRINDGMALGKLELEATIEELEILKIYGEGKLGIRQIDDILSNVIRPIQVTFFDEAFNFTDRMSFYLYEHRIIFGSTLLVLFVIIIALKVKWTRLRVILLLFDVVVIVSFMLTWWELLQESEIQLAAQRSIYYRIPDECKQGEISFFKSIMLFFGIGKGDCLKYYEAVMTDPVLKVTPLHAFSHMSTKFFFHPLSMAGHYLSDFIEGITSPLPFPFNCIAKLVLVIFMPGLVGTLLIISLGGSMGLRVGPFFHLYLHSRHEHTPAVPLENVNRQAIEVIRSDIAVIRANTTANGQSSEPVRTNSPKKVVATQTDIIKPGTSANGQSSEPVRTKSPKKVEVVTPTEKTVPTKPSKPEDSDTNSDEFPEEKEYEKVSRVRLEEEIKKETVSDISDSNSKKESSKNENESIKSVKTDLKNKTSIEVKSKDD